MIASREVLAILARIRKLVSVMRGKYRVLQSSILYIADKIS